MGMDLRTFLRKENLTAPQFAEQVGVSVFAVNKWVSGVRTPRPKLMDKIMEATQNRVTPNDFARRRAA